MRDYGPADDRCGSFTTDAAEATPACLSAVARKRTNGPAAWDVRFVPKADSCSAAKKHRYSITSSAIDRRPDGIVSPSVLAVCRLLHDSQASHP
jgi:hypothetical protein